MCYVSIKFGGSLFVVRLSLRLCQKSIFNFLFFNSRQAIGAHEVPGIFSCLFLLGSFCFDSKDLRACSKSASFIFINLYSSS